MIEYRGARIHDLKQLMPLMEAFVRERAGIMDQKLRENFMEFARGGMAQALESPAAFVCLAEEGGCAIGYAVGAIQEPPPLFEDVPYIFISDLYVQPAARGRGVGTALVERVRGWGLMRGVTRCSMVVPVQSDAARKLAARVGARQVEGLYYWHSPI